MVTMIDKLKRGGALFGAAFLVAVIVVPVLFSGQAKAASKEYATGVTIPEFCDLPTSEYSPRNKKRAPGGWMSIRFKNRASIEVTYKPGGCPGDKLIGTVDIAPLITLTMTDINTSDGDFDYRNEKGKRALDDSRIDNFDTKDGGCGVNKDDATGGRDQILDIPSIRQCLEAGADNGAEYVISVEEDVVGGFDCTGVQNGNFVYTLKGNSYEWNCIGSGTRADVSLETGLLIAKLFSDADLENFNVTYGFKNGKIQHVSRDEQNTRSFTWCGSNWDNGANCSGNLELLNEDNSKVGEKDFEGVGAGTKDVFIHKKGGNSRVKVRIAGSDNPAGNPVNPDGTPIGEGGSREPEIGCDFSLKNPLTWIACPIIDAANAAVRLLDNAITQKLHIDTDGNNSPFNENSPTGAGLYQAWDVVRKMSLAFIIIGILAMVISQALNIGIFEAYTIKKVLPKLLVAALLMTISWDLCKLAINISNDIGLGVRALMYIPIRDLPPLDSGGNSVVNGIITIGVVGFAAAFGIIGLLSFGVTALLAVGTALAILVFREMALIVLVVFAPLAFASNALPNTQKIWKFWWETFSKALLMFPIMMAFIMSGRVIATIIKNSAPDGQIDAFQQIVMFIAYFGPYFALPKALTLAGGLVGTLTGMANNRSKGMFDRTKNFRTNTRKARKENAAYGNYLNRDKKNIRGFMARRSLNANALGSGQSPVGLKGTRAGWSRGQAAQAAQGEKVQQDAFQQELIASQLEGSADLSKHLQALATGKKVEFNGKTLGGDRASKQWAMDQIGKKGLIPEARAVQEYFENSTEGKADKAGQTLWQGAKQSNFGSFNEKAPDMVKGAGSLTTASSESMASWDTSTFSMWREQFADAKAKPADPVAVATVSRMEAQMKGIKDSEKIKASMGAENLAILSGNAYIDPSGKTEKDRFADPAHKSTYDGL